MPVLLRAAALPAVVLALPVDAQTSGPDVIVIAAPPPSHPAGQTVTTIDADAIRAAPATTVADLVRLAPGVAVLQGNGPRDMGVSIRGSNARSSFGARNIRVFEDDFPVTQPDGLARFDLTDPRAYGAVDVVRGPSSARYGNHALGGAINFRTRRGRDIRGVEAGADFGSHGYANVHAVIGNAGTDHDYAIFGSLAGGNGAIGHTGWRAGTINAFGTLARGPRDRLAAKVIHHEGTFALATRLSLNQYRANPYQRGCARAANAAAGCGTVAVLANGRSGARIVQAAAEADLGRDDRRTIVGLRHERDLGTGATWRTQATADARVIFQPTSALAFRGAFNSWAVSSEVTVPHRLLGAEATGFLGVYLDRLDSRSYSFNKTPGGRRGIGAPTQAVLGYVADVSLRAREELALAPTVDLVLGLGAERSIVAAEQTGWTYPQAAAPVAMLIPARRIFRNVAPEASLRWRATPAVQLHARVGTGYGIPQAGNLFVTAEGLPGNNVGLAAQRTTGVDVGAVVALGQRLRLELTGYHEWFRNELVSQSAGPDRLSYTANAPRSVHRGIELGLDWQLHEGTRLTASYGYNDHRYTDFEERLTAGTVSALIDRAGRRIPGVVPHAGTLRIAHRTESGLGGFVEAVHRSRYAIDNANLLSVPGHTIVNLTVRYDPPAGDHWARRIRLFAGVQNLFDATHIGGAAVIASSLDPATGTQNGATVLADTTGTIYAGQPRTIMAGLVARF